MVKKILLEISENLLRFILNSPPPPQSHQPSARRGSDIREVNAAIQLNTLSPSPGYLLIDYHKTLSIV